MTGNRFRIAQDELDKPVAQCAINLNRDVKCENNCYKCISL